VFAMSAVVHEEIDPPEARKQTGEAPPTRSV
jgi:hypothetical protein